MDEGRVWSNEGTYHTARLAGGAVDDRDGARGARLREDSGALQHRR